MERFTFADTAERVVATLVETVICKASLSPGMDTIQRVASKDGLSAFIVLLIILSILICNLYLNRNDYGEHGDNSYYGPVGLHSFPASSQEGREHQGR